MDIRADQLLFIVMMVLFALADMVFRRFRNRGDAPRDQQAETAPEMEGAEAERPLAGHEAEYEEDIQHDRARELEEMFGMSPEPEVAPPPSPPPPLPIPRAAPVHALPAVRSHRALVPPTPRPAPLRRRRTMTLALDAGEARRAIILMTVLGPCRALEMRDRD